MHSPVDSLSHLIERFDHVAYGVERIEDALPTLDLLGAVFYDGADHVRNDFRWAQFKLPDGSKLEYLAPLSEASFMRKYLDQHGPGMHHVTLKVSDIAETARLAEAAGFRTTGYSESDMWSEVFLHPKSANGALIQLAQWDYTSTLADTLADVLAGRVIDDT